MSSFNLINHKYEDDNTLLHKACSTSVSFKFVEHLVKANANILAKNKAKMNSFQCACTLAES